MGAFLLLSVLAQDLANGKHASTFPSPRLAAVAFAIQHGFEIPRTNLIVAPEVRFGGINDVPRLPGDRSTTLPIEETKRDATAIAKLLGPGVKTGPAQEYLSCPRRQCYASTTWSVLVVDELKNNEPGVYLKLYTPGSSSTTSPTLLHAIVDVTRSGPAWVAERFIMPPEFLHIRF